jgi:hypothetical protein
LLIYPWYIPVKHNQTSTWKDKKFAGNAEDWDRILSFILLGIEQNDSVQGVEAAARVEEGPELKIIIQRRIEEITVRIPILAICPD